MHPSCWRRPKSTSYSEYLRQSPQGMHAFMFFFVVISLTLHVFSNRQHDVGGILVATCIPRRNAHVRIHGRKGPAMAFTHRESSKRGSLPFAPDSDYSTAKYMKLMGGYDFPGSCASFYVQLILQVLISDQPIDNRPSVISLASPYLKGIMTHEATAQLLDGYLRL